MSSKHKPFTIDNPTLEDVEIKHRENIKQAIDKLSTILTQDEWDLTVYLEGTSQYNSFGKYVVMYWEDPYTFKFGVLNNDTYIFEICDSTWDTTVLDRRVEFKDFHIGEIDFFIDSIKEFLVLKDKLYKFTNSYNSSSLPDGYKRNEKIGQLLT